jgi:intein/homing endonuclease
MAFEIIEDRAGWERENDIRFVTYHSDGGKFHGVDLPEEWDVEYEPEESFDSEIFQQRTGDLVGVTPSEFTEFAVMMPNKEKNTYEPFSFGQRRYLRQIYDTPGKRVLLKCGRQVEKTLVISTTCVLFNGAPIRAGDVQVGHWLATMSTDENTLTYGQITWVSKHYEKPCIKIKTRQGHELTIALTHPMRLWNKWVEGARLKVGDRLAAVRRCGVFHEQWRPEAGRIEFTAYMIGDGHLGEHYSFTSLPGPKLDEFISIVSGCGGTYSIQKKAKTLAVSVTVNRDGPFRNWMKADGLHDTRSATKFVPYWVWGLSKENTALFLNRLWSTDGHVKKNGSSKYSIEYCSISQHLIKDVQALLWKFGIPSKVRENWPNIYKKRGEKKLAYVLRVETQEGVRRFLSEIGTLGKAENIDVPESGSNNNRDTFPEEVNDLIRQIIESRGDEGRMGRYAEKGKSLRTASLRETLKYPPTMGKVRQYVAFFRSDERYDQSLTDKLEALLSTDLYWDEIVSIEDVGVQTCIDFEVEGTHNFVAEGLITHNSTMLGNKLLSYSCINTALNSLYVSPTNMQAKVFSQDRLKEPIETSPYLKSWTTTKLSDNVFLKKFINRSQVTLRYAYLNADRCRGIPADVICLDEVQDLLTDNIPVIEQCAFHSTLMFNGVPHKGGIFLYSGTPKSLDNTLEKYWTEQSTQNEWVVPCRRHTLSSGTGISSKIYWNILTEDHMGLDSLVCDKCRMPINPADEMAQWVSMNPEIYKTLRGQPFEGYRIPQLMVPWVKYENLLRYQQTYPRGRFYNEVLGLSYDSGTRPLTRQDVIDNCDEELILGPDFLSKIHSFVGHSYPVYAGIDWGCHDEQTRILTSRGFVYFKDLVDDDQVAQWDPTTREMSFVTPKVRTVRDWDQPLLHFKSKNVDMMLTHTHRMRVQSQAGGEWQDWRTESAGDVADRGGHVKFPGSIIWLGKEEEVFTLPGLPVSSGYHGSSNAMFRMDGWLEFLGYYLSEGGLCLRNGKPYCIKLSQRETVNADRVKQIRECFHSNDIPFSEFPNPKTGDVNWTICGKQFWDWVDKNVGRTGDTKRIPRQFLELSSRQLSILFWAMMLGDRLYIDTRTGNYNGSYYSTSKGLCEDFQEICIKLGLRAKLSLHKPASEGRKARWRVMWSRGMDHQFNSPSTRVERVPYNGKVYCCSVPSGYIITERNGCIAYQGNTGEQTYTVISLGAYMGDGKFTIFHVHRYEGRETDPDIQLDDIARLIQAFNIQLVGCDYGGGFHMNDKLTKRFGFQRVVKYQYSQPSTKVVWQDGLKRFLVHRTEVMSDVFNAIKRRDVFRFPNWTQFAQPFAMDMLNIFSEYSEQLRQNVYKKTLNATDDTFHSILLCFLASMLRHPRPDIISPTAATGSHNPDD